MFLCSIDLLLVKQEEENFKKNETHKNTFKKSLQIACKGALKNCKRRKNGKKKPCKVKKLWNKAAKISKTKAKKKKKRG